MANWLDRAIGLVSPQRQVNRELARLRASQIARARMAYDGATRGRRANDWRAVSTDANSEIATGGSRLRDVARDMVRNNPHAARAVSVITNDCIGSGIIPSIETRSKATKARLETLLKAHFDTTACDVVGRHDLYGLQRLALRCIVESGEVIIRLRPRRVSDGLPLPFQLQIMEPDHLDTLVDGQLSNGNYAVQGVEYDAIGRIVAYHLFAEHPGSMRTISMQTSRRIPAEFVAHVFDSQRAEQNRGVSWFAPVVVTMRDFAEFADAHLMRQKIAACFAVFVQSDDSPDGSTESGDPYDIETVSPGMIERLRPGEDVKFGSPPPVGDYGEYTKAMMRQIAAGLNVSYEALTGDYSSVNFSSGRMGWLQYDRAVSGWRNYMLIPQMLQPIAKWFLDAAALEIGRRNDVSVKWTAPRREMIDPATEIKAINASIRSGLTTRSFHQRQLGFDPEAQEAEFKRDNEVADEMGFVFDTDPRKVSAAGLTQARQPTYDIPGEPDVSPQADPPAEQ